jgi:protein-tyrosine phosphatase
MASTESNPPAGKLQTASFGDKPLAEVTSTDISKLLADWLTGVLKEIDETEEKDESGKVKPHQHYHLDFPSALSAAQRKLVHHHAYTLKLRSTSHGDGEGRFLRITLANRGSLSEKVLEFVKSDKLEEAMNHRDTGKNSKVPKGMSLITENLYLGSGKDAQDKEALQEAGVTVILNATAEWKTSHHHDFTHHRIDLSDNIRQSLSVALETACKIIKEAHSSSPPAKVLVHCVMGRSRSASIVMAYLVLHENMTLKEAFELTHKARPIVRPNSRFLSDLIEWEVKHRGTATFEVNSWVDIVGVHGSQLHAWKAKKLPPPIQLPPERVHTVAQTISTEYLTEKIYLKVVKSHCNNAYEARYIPKFILGIKQTVEADQVLVAKAREQGVIDSELAKAAGLIAKDWYIGKVPKETRTPKSKKGGASAAASSSSSSSSPSSSSSAPSSDPAEATEQ